MPQAPLAGFDSRKAAQIAAYFTARQPDIEKLKLIKLMYLAERAALAKYGRPMIYDELYSLKDGPICSSALNGINGEIDSDTWSRYIVMDANRRNIHLQMNVSRDDLDEVSDAEMDVLESVWSEFGHFTAGQIRQWTHDHCPEYTEVDQGRVPITYAALLQAIGVESISDIEADIAQARKLSSYLLA